MQHRAARRSISSKIEKAAVSAQSSKSSRTKPSCSTATDNAWARSLVSEIPRGTHTRCFQPIEPVLNGRGKRLLVAHAAGNVDMIVMGILRPEDPRRTG